MIINRKKNRVKGEPGEKIPLCAYKIVGQWCEECDDVTMHAFSIKTSKIRCLYCKTTKEIGRKRKR